MEVRMANEVKITVVVPVHNSEKYLKECLESALSQSFKDIEILCIDGGSTGKRRQNCVYK